MQQSGRRSLARKRVWPTVPGAALLVVTLLAGCSTGAVQHATAPSGPRPSAHGLPPGGFALAAAEHLRVVTAARMTGYSRGAFGRAWSDDERVPLGHNGCDTRNDILRRDLFRIVVEPGTNGCVVLTGTLHDPYTARAIAFVRGPESDRVQIDHVVALGNAWQTGAAGWSESQRQALANDPLELLAVDGPTNEAKGDADASGWLPPNAQFRCAYVARQVAVKHAYDLGVTSAERATMVSVLRRCPGQRLVVEPGTVGPIETHGPVEYAQRAATPGTGSGAVFYPDCAAARAAGAAPLSRGRPGYRPELDGDGDGVACED